MHELEELEPARGEAVPSEHATQVEIEVAESDAE